jgi:GDP-L-fucose synthase
MNKDSKIFVAGGTGMVGSAIISKLASSGYTNIFSHYHRREAVTLHPLPVRFIKLDLTCQADTEAFFEEERPDYVFLAAAKVGGILANSLYKAEFIYENVMIASNIINSAYKCGVKKLLNLGSSCIYPKFAPQPLKEEYFLTGGLEPTNEPYAIAKIAAIKLCRYYNDQYETNFISVMPTNLYGQNDNFDLEVSHVIPALVRKFHLAKLLSREEYDKIIKDLKLFGNLFTNKPFLSSPTGGSSSTQAGIDSSTCQLISAHLSQFGIHPDKVILWGTGEPFREFLHVDDLADACMLLIENYNYKDIGEFINIGTGVDIQIKELASLIKKIVGFEGDISYDHTKPDGTPKKLLDISRIKILGWEAKIGLEEGIKRTYEWYVSRLSED